MNFTLAKKKSLNLLSFYEFHICVKYQINRALFHSYLVLEES